MRFFSLFSQGVRNRLRPLRKGMRSNIFDNMLSMMEKYATRLETLVDERTQLLVEEKKKTDALLLEMLPRPVAEALKQVKQDDVFKIIFQKKKILIIFFFLSSF